MGEISFLFLEFLKISISVTNTAAVQPLNFENSKSLHQNEC